jgi:hypothetical protein
MATGRVPTTANSPLTAKGDLFTYSTASARLAVGNNGESLVADSAATTGLRYQGNYAAGKNKFINGNMAIAQRGTSAISVPSTNTTTYGTDRWFGLNNGGGVTSITQSTTAPAGFGYSSLLTVTTADASIAAGDYYLFGQRIEGFNSASFEFGTASAKTITLSFWVRSSATGTFSVCVSSSDEGRWYVGTYTINTANTFEYKTVTITGDTSGTWSKDSSTGMAVYFTLGNGSTFDGTAGTWNSSAKFGTSASVDLIATLNATMYITGVQLEIGSVATAFQTATGTIQGELAACQRYFAALPSGSASDNYATFANGYTASSTKGAFVINLPVPMRIYPTMTYSAANTFATHTGTSTVTAGTSIATDRSSPNTIWCSLTVASGLTAGNALFLIGNNTTSAKIEASAEL